MKDKSMFLNKLKAIGESKGLKAPDGFGAIEQTSIESEDGTTIADHVKMIKDMPDFDPIAVIKMLLEDAEEGMDDMMA